MTAIRRTDRRPPDHRTGGQLSTPGDRYSGRNLLALLMPGPLPDTAALNLLGVIRIAQRHFEEAVLSLLTRACRPRQPWIALNLGNALAGLAASTRRRCRLPRRPPSLKPDFSEALHGLGGVPPAPDNWRSGERIFRKLQRFRRKLAALQALGAVLIDAGRCAEAVASEPGRTPIRAIRG